MAEIRRLEVLQLVVAMHTLSLPGHSDQDFVL